MLNFMSIRWDGAEHERRQGVHHDDDFWKVEKQRVFIEKCFRFLVGSTSHPGGNQVDGLPPAPVLDNLII